MLARLARTAAVSGLAAALLWGTGCGNDREPDGIKSPTPPSQPSPSPSPSPSPPPSPPLQPVRGGVLARLDCTPANFPNCDWSDAGSDSGNYTPRLLQRQGPHGQDAVEFVQLAGPMRQYYMGWGSPSRGDEPAGTVRYLRARIWIPGPSGQLNGYHGGWESKFLILGDGGNAAGRVICLLRDNGRTIDTMSLECQRNIDGGDHSTGLLPLTLGAWHNIQVEARSGPSASIAVWIDTNDYARPTARTPGNYSLDTTNWQFLGVGFYVNTPRSQSQDLVALRIADDVELAAGFDPAWHH